MKILVKNHGYRNHKHYRKWYDLNRRCYDTKCKNYADYGGRGIDVCEAWRWAVGPKTFCDWADSTYKDGLFIDRQDNNAGYSPENCRWVDRFESMRNRRQYKPSKPYQKQSALPRGVRFNGKRYITQVWCKGANIYVGSYDTAEAASIAVEYAWKAYREMQGRATV